MELLKCGNSASLKAQSKETCLVFGRGFLITLLYEKSGSLGCSLFLSMVLSLITFVLTTDVEAEEYRLNLHLASHHLIEREDGEQWNEKNFGLGIDKRFSSYYIEGGYFKNSYFEDSLYGITGKTLSYRGVQLAVFVGAASGYPEEVSQSSGLRVIAGVSAIYQHVKITATHKFLSLSLLF